MICAVIRAGSDELAAAEMQEARRAGADLCELRLDYLKSPDVARLLSSRPLPVIATARPAWEGGRFEGTEADRVGLLEDACLNGAEYVDLEFRAYKDISRRQAKLILSYHDFEGTPADLETVAGKMKLLEPFLVKIACRARGGADLARLAALQKSLGVPGAVIAMGDYGEPLRVLPPRYGGFLAYAAVRAGAETAPGQPTLEDLVRRWRVKAVDDATEVYAVAGDPVAHSRSPDLFNDVFRHLGMNARYVRLRLDDAGALRGIIAALELRGLSVTIPHKQAVLGALDLRDEAVAGIGAANTIVVRDGRLAGHNTDAPAAVEAIREAAVRKWSHGIYGMRALVLGAGGAARAIAWGFKREAARVVIANRTFERGKALAEDLGVEAARWGDLLGVRAQIVVNATPVGMEPEAGASPVDPGLFRKDMVAMDTVYTPRLTRFLKDAKAAGAEAVDGVEMFLRQANAQFRLWTGRDMPREVLKEYAQTL